MKANVKRKAAGTKAKRQRDMKGISVVELIIVLVIISILTAISIPYIYNYKKLYKSEDQALKVMDLMREANQLALVKRRTFRFEIDLTDNKALIIDENSTGAADDKELKAIPLEPTRDVRMDAAPTGVTAPNPPNYNDAAFATDSVGHKSGGTTVNNHNVWVARFKTDGSVVKTNDTLVSATLYFFPPLTPGNANPRIIKEVRAVTIFGGSGAVRYWKHDGTTFQPY